MSEPTLAPAPAAPAPQPVDVVVHTHWDREWYLPRETTLARLEAVMAEVLDLLETGALPSFLFDGQTVALRDLLAVASPGLAQRVRRQAEAGRLVLGPWYVSADEFLVSGESLLRNLEIGLADAASFGPPQRLGYLPDTFGHVAQMPQILSQFGIRHAVVWRGADAVHDRFTWVAPDGSTVGTVFLTQGYYLHPLHAPDADAALQALLQGLQARRAAGVRAPLLLTHGGDHLAPRPELPERIAAFNARGLPFRLRVTTLQDHAQALLSADGPCEVLHGELRNNAQAFVLPDVLSTRRHLKRAHQEAEDRLLGEIEPLRAQLLPGPSDTEALQRAWRTLIEQQAHDSLCGCSIDAVHAEMAQRFVQLGQHLDALREDAAVAGGLISRHRHGPHEPSPWDDDARCTLFNPLPRHCSGWHLVSLFLKGPRHEALRVTTAQGEPWPCEVVDAQPAEELVSPLDDFPERLVGWRYEVAVQADLAGLGAQSLRVEGMAQTRTPPGPHLHTHPGIPERERALGLLQSGDVDPAGQNPVEASPGQARAGAGPALAHIDNAAWHVSLGADGRLVLTDRLQGRTHAGVFSLLSELDAGDAYNWSPPAQPCITQANRWRLLSSRRCGPLKELRVALDLDLPAGLDAERQAADPCRVTSRGVMSLRLLGDDPLLRVRLHWHNAARDQRTRLILPGLPDDLDATWSDTAFAWTARPVRHASVPAQASRQEMPVAVLPSQSALVAGPWAIVHRALHEHEILRPGVAGAGLAPALALTLVRSVGWLSRRDLVTRGVGAGPDLATPGAQCLGDDVFDLGLVAHPASIDAFPPAKDRPPSSLAAMGANRGEAGKPTGHGPAPGEPHLVLAHAERWRRPLQLLRGWSTRWAPAVDLGNDTVCTSSVRRLGDGTLELRLWNPTGRPQSLALSTRRWRAVHADGRPLEAFDAAGQLTLRPFGILTVRQSARADA